MDSIIAFIVYSTPWKGMRCQTVPHDKGLAILDALHGLTEPDESQLEYLSHIKNVYVPSQPSDWKQPLAPNREPVKYVRGVIND